MSDIETILIALALLAATVIIPAVIRWRSWRSFTNARLGELPWPEEPWPEEPGVVRRLPEGMARQWGREKADV